MPGLGFILPHWLYWSGLLLFPLVAWWFTARQLRRAADQRPSLFVAYLFWLLSGFLGIHRFYLRSAWGVVFVPVFLAMMGFNAQVRAVRDDTSRTFAAYESAERGGDAAALAAAKRDYDAAAAVSAHWNHLARTAAGLLGLMLLVDAALLPRAVRRRRELETAAAAAQAPAEPIPLPVVEGGVGEDPTLKIHTRFTDWIDNLSTLFGRYVAWWALIAVFGYYYEVLARYVFNSPTNWVHESMFLMFGMQYMLCGAFAYREDQHVRVDVLYVKLSTRGRAIADIVTSVFFFTFVLTMLWTGARFALDAISVGERSFTEWGVEYWPVKLTIPIGAALLALQGLSRLIKDITLVLRPRA
jgi:TRAP-type mannitol/chloroaromatic compound transport system permease small subunit